MHRRSLEVLACPRCLGPLVAKDDEEDVEDGLLVCTRDGLPFPVVDGIPHLIRPERAEALRRFARDYSGAWQRDGWGAHDAAYLVNLPMRDTTGRRSSEWKVKARSMDAVLRFLRARRVARVLDLGCGVGWLAAHLAARGLEVFAADIVLDDVLGLGAARAYLERGIPFERIWAELDRIPARDDVFGAVICNASLHYASDPSVVADEAARVLQPRAVFIVMNSPVHRDPASAQRAERDFRRHLEGLGAPADVVAAYRHFVLRDLEELLRARFQKVQLVPFDPGRMFRWIRAIKGLGLRMELATFPILVATKTSAADST